MFAGLLALFGVTAAAEAVTANQNLLPGLIALGAFAVPVSFVVLVSELLPRAQVPVRTVVICFVAGGVLGTAAASLLEYGAADRIDMPHALVVGAIEEPTKLIVPLIVFALGVHRRTADGIIVGVAAAMGFAAFETMGYALKELAGPAGSVNAATDVLLLRGVLAPFGHPAWTGLVCAALWWARARWHRTRAASLLVPAALLAAVTLHGSWNGFDGRLIGAVVMGASLLLLGIWLLLARREVRPEVRPAAAAPLPA